MEIAARYLLLHLYLLLLEKNFQASCIKSLVIRDLPLECIRLSIDNHIEVLFQKTEPFEKTSWVEVVFPSHYHTGCWHREAVQKR